MPLIPIFLPHGGGSASSSTLAFVDASGLNPLPPGVIVTLTTGTSQVASAMLQAGGVMPITIQNGTYLASFKGTQAPLTNITFTTVGVGSTTVTVPNYVSPAYSGDGYAQEAAYALVLYWHDVTLNSDTWVEPSGYTTSYLPASVPGTVQVSSPLPNTPNGGTGNTSGSPLMSLSTNSPIFASLTNATGAVTLSAPYAVDTLYSQIIAGLKTFSSGIAVTGTPGISSTYGVTPGYGGSFGTAVIYSGNGIPNFSAAAGSLYLSFNGAVYLNISPSQTSGSSWSALNTATSSGPLILGYNGNVGTALIYSGYNAPTFSATQGSMFLSSNGSVYVNTSLGTGTIWVSLAPSSSTVASISTSGSIFSPLSNATGAVTISAPNAVDTTSTQTIGGPKTFSSPVTLIGGLTSDAGITLGYNGSSGTPVLYGGSGVPSFSTTEGSLFLSSNGSVYVNTSTVVGTTWTALQSGSGAVTSVTGTSPISSSGGTNPVISIASSPTFAGTVNAAAISATGSVTAAQFNGSGAGLTAGSVPSNALATQPVTAVSATGNLASTGGLTPAISITSAPTFTGTVTAGGFTGSGAGLTSGTIPNGSLSIVPLDVSSSAQTKAGSLTIGGTLSAAAVSITNPLAIGSGGTGTTSPSIVNGTNTTTSGVWPNQAINVPTMPAAAVTSGTFASGLFTFQSGLTVNGASLLVGGGAVGTNGNAGSAAGLFAKPGLSVLSWNASGGQGEVDIYSSFSTGNTATFWKSNGTTAIPVTTIDGVGNLTVAGGLSTSAIFDIRTFGASPSATAATNNAAIQAAITAAQAATNGVALISPGTYNVSASMNVYSNTTIWLQGTLHMTNGANICFFYIWAPASNIHIFGTGTLDVNGANQSAFFASGIINQSSASGSLVGALFEGFSIINAYYWPINLIGCSNVTLRDVTVTNANPYTGFAGANGPSGLGFAGDTANSRAATNCWIENCTVNNAFDYGIAFYGKCVDCGVRDSRVNNVGATTFISGVSGPNNCNGILVLNDSGQPQPSNGVVISGNTVTGCSQQGIVTLTNTGGSGTHSNVRISDNYTHGNSLAGLYLSSATQVHIANNVFQEGTTAGGSLSAVTQAPIPGVSFVPVSNGANSGTLSVSIAGIGFPSNLVVMVSFNSVAPGWYMSTASILINPTSANAFTITVANSQLASSAGYCNVYWLASGN